MRRVWRSTADVEAGTDGIRRMEMTQREGREEDCCILKVPTASFPLTDTPAVSFFVLVLAWCLDASEHGNQ